MTKIKFLTKKQLITYKKSINLTSIQKEIIVGTLLGDASMSSMKGTPVYAIKFEQSIKNINYINHLFKVFEAFCTSSPAKRYIDKDQKREAIYFKTLRHPSFIYYYNIFYKNKELIDKKTGLKLLKKTKVVPKNIHQLLTIKALAYWFMDDGTYDTGHCNTKSYVFSTQGFEKHECTRLLNALKCNFNLKGAVHRDKNKWRIYINRESSIVLKEMIKDLILPDFIYKLK